MAAAESNPTATDKLPFRLDRTLIGHSLLFTGHAKGAPAKEHRAAIGAGEHIGSRECPVLLYRLCISIRRYRHPHLGGSHIDSTSIAVDRRHILSHLNPLLLFWALRHTITPPFFASDVLRAGGDILEIS